MRFLLGYHVAVDGEAAGWFQHGRAINESTLSAIHQGRQRERRGGRENLISTPHSSSASSVRLELSLLILFFISLLFSFRSFGTTWDPTNWKIRSCMVYLFYFICSIYILLFHIFTFRPYLMIMMRFLRSTYRYWPMSVVHVNIMYCYDRDYSFSLVHKPRFILVENVSGFEASIARQKLVDVLTSLNYTVEVPTCLWFRLWFVYLNHCPSRIADI